MNMKRVVVIMSLALCFVLGYFCLPLTAQEQTPVATETEYSNSSGVVESISESELVLKEYDFTNNAMVDVSYVLDPEVKIINADAFEAIVFGTKLDVSYVVEDDKRIAKVLIVVVEQEQSEKPPVQ